MSRTVLSPLRQKSSPFEVGMMTVLFVVVLILFGGFMVGALVVYQHTFGVSSLPGRVTMGSTANLISQCPQNMSRGADSGTMVGTPIPLK
jgi:hypothetical protein